MTDKEGKIKQLPVCIQTVLLSLFILALSLPKKKLSLIFLEII